MKCPSKEVRYSVFSVYDYDTTDSEAVVEDGLQAKSGKE
jgi:hypothetical protein